MGKFFLRFFLLNLVIVVAAVIFLSYVGLNTDKFNDLIKEKANSVHRNVKLEFKNTKIYLNPTELNLIVKLKKPKVLIKNSEINLSKIDLFLSLQSFFNSNFLLKRAEIAFKRNDIKDLVKITSAFLPKLINKQLNKIFLNGKLEGEFIIPFNKEGKVEKDYGFSGKISNATINLTKEFLIENLTTEISREIKSEKNSYTATVKKGSLSSLDLSGSSINIENKNNIRKIKALLNTKGKIDFNKIKKVSTLLGTNINQLNDITGDVDLKTKIDFDLNKNFKVKNLLYSITGNIYYLELDTDEKEIIKKYFPEYNARFTFKDLKISFTKSQNNKITELEGLLKQKNHFDSFKILSNYNNKKAHDVEGTIDLTNSKIKISRLNYSKESGKKSETKFSFNFVLDKHYNLKDLKFFEDKTQIHLSNIKFNKNFELVDFEKLKVTTFSNGVKNNDFLVNKSKSTIISGKIFDAQPLLKSLYTTNDKKIFSKKFNSKIQINFNKTITGTNDDLSNFALIGEIKKGSFIKLNLKGNFSENEIVEMSIYQIDSDQKTLQVFSDRARPFVKNFNFIKGFEKGKLEYESNILKNSSKSKLVITDFKVSKVPALAQLLTLASLQGIADTLSGEGIRFDSFEMQSNSKNNILNVEEALALGPAVSILLDGYVDKGKTVSLRGTLVPATKLNAIIASIPVVGDILVGKKTGEGVVGVSFKMKGPPKKIKTTVNPIKTLTPRFIVRALEKIKKQKKEEIK